MTAPLPSRLSPIAGFTNALYRLYIRRAAPVVAELEVRLALATAKNEHLKGDRP